MSVKCPSLPDSPGRLSSHRPRGTDGTWFLLFPHLPTSTPPVTGSAGIKPAQCCSRVRALPAGEVVALHKDAHKTDKAALSFLGAGTQSFHSDSTCTQCAFIPPCPLGHPCSPRPPPTWRPRAPCPSVSVPLAFPRLQVLRASPGLGVDVSAVALPASLLCVSVNASFSHCPLPGSAPSSFPLSHACLLCPSPVHLVAPFSTSGHNQERLCLCLCSTHSAFAKTQPRTGTRFHPSPVPRQVVTMSSGTTDTRDRAALCFSRHPSLLGQNDFSWFIYKLWRCSVPCTQTEQLGRSGWLGASVVLGEGLLSKPRPSCV